MLVETALSKLVTSAAATVGSRLATAALGMKDKARKQDVAAATALRTGDVLISIDWGDTPLPFDPAWLAGVVEGADYGALVRELLCLRLVDGPAARHDELRTAFVALLVGIELAPELARRIFDAIDDACARLVRRVADGHPETHARLMANAHLALIEATLDNLARHLRFLTGPTGYSPVERDEFVLQYRRQLVKAHGYIEPPDFDRRRKVPLEDLYVSPRFTREADESPLDELRANLDRAVILGDPGGGKTTASTAIVLRTARQAGGPLPFFVTLREFAKPGEADRSVLEYIEHRLTTFYQVRPLPGLVERCLVNGDAIVVFDGLDELLDTTRRREITEIVELFATRYPMARILVTSRRIGYDQAPMDPATFGTHELSGFSEDDVRQYVHKWFAQNERPAADAESFLAESTSVPDLRTNPLMLSLMCIIYRGENSIPRNRPEIYERCATMLYEKWDSSRHIQVVLRAGTLIDPILKHLAYWMLTSENEGEGGLPRSVVVRQVTDYLAEHAFEDADQARAAAVEFVDFCRGRAWVFTDAGSTADGEPLYKFTHRTFLEFFAAHQLVRRCGSPERVAHTLLPKVAAGEWDVVAQLAVQIVNKNAERGADRVFEVMLGNKRHNRAAVLGFLARCLAFVLAKPTLARRVTRECVLLMAVGGEALSLTFPEEQSAVLDEVCTVLRELVAHTQPMNVRINAATIALTLESQTIAGSFVAEHGTALRELALHDQFLGARCVLDGSLSIDDYVTKSVGGATPLERLFTTSLASNVLHRVPPLAYLACLGNTETTPWRSDCFVATAQQVRKLRPPYLSKFKLATMELRPNLGSLSGDARFGQLFAIAVNAEVSLAMEDPPVGFVTAWFDAAPVSRRVPEMLATLSADQVALLDDWSTRNVSFTR